MSYAIRLENGLAVDKVRYGELRHGFTFEDTNENTVKVEKKGSKYYLWDIGYKQWLHDEIPEYIFDKVEDIFETYKSGGNPIKKVLS